tara:strand:- start:328 stop:822 length:495 start_codon:yes stop_codon:yes gene_type:complete
MNRLLILLLPLILISCGFYSFTGASISPETETVSINYFENKANIVQASLSSVLTEELKNYFTNQTNLIITQDEGDLTFSGEITSYDIQPISIQSNQTAKQNRLTIKVRVQFINKKDERMNFNNTFTRHKDFSSEENISSLEESLISDICKELSEDIFNKALVNW